MTNKYKNEGIRVSGFADPIQPSADKIPLILSIKHTTDENTYTHYVNIKVKDIPSNVHTIRCSIEFTDEEKSRKIKEEERDEIYASRTIF